MKFVVTIVAPPGYPHSAALLEVAETVTWGLRELGHDAVLRSFPADPPDPSRRLIVFGAHLLPPGTALPPGSIIYNLEQVESSPLVTPDYLRLLGSNEAWDYAPANVTALAAKGIQAKLVPIGYAPGLTRIPPSPVQDIDVLFYGSVNDRRLGVLQDLANRGVMTIGAAAYGARRDSLIARSRIVLNVHFYPAQVFEIVRVSYLLANRVCVVSEDPVVDGFREGMAFVPYTRLADRCRELLADRGSRFRLAIRGYEIMKSRRERDYLQAALASGEYRIS